MSTRDREVPLDRLAPLLARLDSAMLVVTIRAGNDRAGCLVGFHSQCSIEPLRYAVWVSRANRSYRIAKAADVFVLHLLDETNRDLAELFGANTGDDIDKFSRCAWHAGTDDAPLLDGCARRVLARPDSVDDDGTTDHVGFVLTPFEVHDDARALRPLRYSDVRDLDAGHAPTDPPSAGPA